jgi:hypothetical protein
MSYGGRDLQGFLPDRVKGTGTEKRKREKNKHREHEARHRGQGEMKENAGSAALAVGGKGEAACGRAILIECGRRAVNRAKRGHGWLQKSGMEKKKPR